jgi:hypothetical protein
MRSFGRVLLARPNGLVVSVNDQGHALPKRIRSNENVAIYGPDMDAPMGLIKFDLRRLTFVMLGLGLIVVRGMDHLSFKRLVGVAPSILVPISVIADGLWAKII